MRSVIRAALTALSFVAVAAGAAQAQQSIRIAYVNTEALMAAAPGKASADSTYTARTQGMMRQLGVLEDSLNKMVAAFQKAEPTLTAAQKESRQTQLQEFYTDMQAKELQFRSDADKLREDLMAPLMESVRKVLEDIRSEDGFALILANDPGASPIVAADKNLDITERVLARLRTISATTRGTTVPAAGPAAVRRPPSQ
jgi:outer membrane protein